jgi:hypothetical protein
MFMALIGAIVALGNWQDRQLREVTRRATSV